MHFILRSSFLSAVLLGIANAVALDLQKRDSPLEVTLAPSGNAVVKATVRNVGTADLKLLTYGTLFDEAPVQKVDVYIAGVQVPFLGILRTVAYSKLSPEAFVSLPAGAVYETTINAATVHELATGSYSVVAEGAIPYAEADSSKLSGSAIFFKSNTLEMKVDGEAASKVQKVAHGLQERVVLQSGCSSSETSSILTSLSNCASLARAASTAAKSGSASKFSEYFKTTSSSVRSTVAARLSAVASGCSSSTSGAVDLYCNDPYGYCDSNVLAYTLPSQNIVSACPIFFSDLPGLTGSCHAQDQATTIIHELTHAPATYSPGTQDNAYGYAASTALSSSQAVLNADTYALYSNAIYAGC